MSSKNKMHFNPCAFPVPIQEGFPQSAFRAVNVTAEQSISAVTPVFPVLYPDEIFDLNNEYDPGTSTFTLKQNGVYSIIASVAFFPNDVTANYRVVINIRVNGIPIVTDNGFFGANPVETGDEASVSAILKLAARDEVSISVFSTTNGIILPEPRGTHFEAARLPFLT
ncbi:complement C1q domain-containing protein [Bacillus cereus group sp. BfR-BA-01383]|uniref:complement C1q domain-containing protein n=1 Tax=Bacillus cereus group sp. BfR-BA-01383 TaxID=2920327 RepID=UPI001F577E88|nr:complement C1q domain-containing protein [Bacillus cereus group sp. BfR-BA-01383]